MVDQSSLFRYSILYIGICLISKVFGCTSTTTQYKRPGDDVTIQFQARTVNSENAGLIVTNQIIDYNDSPLVSVVYKNGVNTYITPCTGCIFTGNAASGDLSIKLDNIQSGQGGTYKHSISEGIKEIKGCVKVYVIGVPTKPNITESKIPFEGESVTLTCSSTSTTAPRDPHLRMMYTWKDGNKIASDTRFTYSDTKNKLTISNVARNDVNKQFTCTAKEDLSNAITSSSSDSKKIDVYFSPDGPPRILTFNNGSTIKVIENNQQKLSCSVTGGNPLATLSWTCFNSGSASITVGSTVTKTVTFTATRGQDRSCTCQSSHPVNGHQIVIVNIQISWEDDFTFEMGGSCKDSIDLEIFYNGSGNADMIALKFSKMKDPTRILNILTSVCTLISGADQNFPVSRMTFSCDNAAKIYTVTIKDFLESTDAGIWEAGLSVGGSFTSFKNLNVGCSVTEVTEEQTTTVVTGAFDNTRQESNNTGLIVGVTLGVLLVAVTLYAIIITICFKRKLMLRETETQSSVSKKQTTYANLSYRTEDPTETYSRPSNDASVAAVGQDKSDSVQMYTDLVSMPMMKTRHMM